MLKINFSNDILLGIQQGRIKIAQPKYGEGKDDGNQHEANGIGQFQKTYVYVAKDSSEYYENSCDQEIIHRITL